jgi:hypothetical protein
MVRLAGLGGIPLRRPRVRASRSPYAIRWLVPKGERFANFDILNDNDTQLDYYRRFERFAHRRPGNEDS